VLEIAERGLFFHPAYTFRRGESSDFFEQGILRGFLLFFVLEKTRFFVFFLRALKVDYLELRYLF